MATCTLEPVLATVQACPYTDFIESKCLKAKADGEKFNGNGTTKANGSSGVRLETYSHIAGLF